MHSGRTGDSWRLGHRPGLDGLRGVAILLVLAAHGELPGFVSAGSTGVVVFFTLSGFLIASLLLEEANRRGAVDVLAFYRRRARRLLPALFVMVAAVSIVGMFLDGYTSVDLQLGSLFYVANWVRAFGGFRGDALGHTWSLSIEEQFYLVAPFVVIALRRRPRTLVTLCGVVAAWSFIERSVLIVRDHGYSPTYAYFATETRLDGLVLGIGLAVAIHRWPRVAARSGWVVGAAVVALCATNGVGSGAQVALAPTLTAIATVGLIRHAVSDRARPMLDNRILRWVGQRSYGIYLWHWPVAALVTRYALPWPATLVIVVGAGVGLAALSWRFVEEPFLRERHATQPQAPVSWVGAGGPTNAS